MIQRYLPMMGEWCKPEDVAELEVENEKLREILYDHWCQNNLIYPKQKWNEDKLFHKYLNEALEE